MDKETFIRILEEHQLPKEDFIILSGGSLLMRGLREKTADFDLCVTKELAEKLNLYSYPTDDHGLHIPFEHCQMMDDYDDFQNYDIVDGFKCETLEEILAFKKEANREKDQADIKMLEEILKNK